MGKQKNNIKAPDINQGSDGNLDPSAVDQIFGPGTLDKLKAGNEGSGFEIPNTLDKDKFPAKASGAPFFSAGVTPGPKDLIGPAYQGNPNGHFKLLNFNKLNNLAIQSALKSRDAAQAQWAAKYPLLAKADQTGMTSSLLNLSGKHDPFIYNALQDAGLGGVDLGSSSFERSRNMGAGQSEQGLLSMEHRDRNFAANVFNDHPITRLGLGPKSVWDVATALTGGFNLASANAAENATKLADAQTNASNQLSASLVGAFGQLAGAGIKGWGDASSPYLNSQTYANQYVTGPMDASGGV